MTKVFDATKFRKSITKSIQGLGIFITSIEKLQIYILHTFSEVDVKCIIN